MRLNSFLKNIITPSFTSVGLDLGNFSIKAAQVKKNNFSQESLLSYGISAIQNAKSRDSIIESISKACEQAKIDTREVNISICGPNITTRYIVLPVMKDADFAKSLEFDLDRYIPYKKEELSVDYHILSKLPNGKMIVLIVAAQRKIIDERVELVKAAGFQVRAINVDALALTESFKAANEARKETAAIIDIGYSLSKLVVVENHVPYFSRDISTAEYAVTSGTSLAQNDISQNNNSAPDDLLHELMLSFEYCERDLGKRIEKLYLTGGGSKNKLIYDTVKQIPNLELEYWDALDGFKLASGFSREEAGKNSIFLGVAIGLALSR